jgi:hypothetical protein
MAWRVLPKLLGVLGVAGVMRAHGGLEYLGVVGGELVGGFPGEVGDLAPGGQALERRVVHVGAEGQTAGRPYPPAAGRADSRTGERMDDRSDGLRTHGRLAGRRGGAGTAVRAASPRVRAMSGLGNFLFGCPGGLEPGNR